MHPSRPKLADHTAAELEAGIRNRRWTNWLPQERILAAELHVSRSTLRDALAKLRRSGAIESVAKKGHRISDGRGTHLRGREAARPQVNLLMPEGFENLRYAAARWIGEFRAQLTEKGWGFRILESKAAYSRRPTRALERIADRDTASCWVLRLSTREMQQWFRDVSLPCVIAGTCFPEVGLPYVDLDHRAVCRHAVGRMVTAGHRRLALLVPEAQKAGDVESELGFSEGAEAAGAGVKALVIRTPADPWSIDKTVGRLFASAGRPSAILVTQPENYLSVFGSLARRGIVVPRDVSLVGCAHDSFLENFYPKPSGYRLNPKRFSDLVLRLVIEIHERGQLPGGHLMLPEFIKGGTLTAPGDGS